MKKGDCVLMPGPSCKTIAVGEIIGNAKSIKGIEILSPDGKKRIDTKFQCSRKVKWLKKANRKNFSPELYGLLNTHQTISSANEYSQWINNILYSFYETGDVYHYIINVKQKRGLNARNLYGVLYELLNTTDEFLESENIKENTNYIDTKISLNSPGYIEFLGQTSNVIVVLCFLVLFINGGGLKIKLKDNFELDLSANSLIKRINEFLNSHADRKLKEKLTRQLGGFQIENPQDIVNILDEINQRNQNDA
jgi:hypothetical protein